jgi:SpoVK/Ycf46/Vps4 family AAA+-type ATPase
MTASYQTRNRAVEADGEDFEVDVKAMRHWAIPATDTFAPAPQIQNRGLAPGAYKVLTTMQGAMLLACDLKTDMLYDLPDTAAEGVLTSIRTFWAREAAFRALGVLYKRGILLYGAPGGGKTATVMSLATQLIAEGGLVVLGEYNSSLLTTGLTMIRKIEPNRPIIAILEDLETYARMDENALLALLDGEAQIDRIVFLATTNNPGKIPERLLARPSRFDEVTEVGMPSRAARLAYLTALTKGHVPEADLIAMADATDGLPVAHLRELVVAVFCLEQPLDKVIARLHGMSAFAKKAEAEEDERVARKEAARRPKA